MKQTKKQYTKKALTLDEQVSKIQAKGIIISDASKAKEYLASIGYYHLGFYIFPFEKTYPCLNRQRKKEVVSGTTIESIVALYYFDFDLRNILNKYLSRLELVLRNTILYEMSVKYKNNPAWFVDSNVVSEQFVTVFQQIYNNMRTKPILLRHHCKYFGAYAPAWKTMEYMTLGNVEALYRSLCKNNDKRTISNRFNEPAIQTFQSYITAIRETRNACAHGNVLFDMKLSFGIRTGMACSSFPNNTQQNFCGALKVIDYLLRQVSTNRANEMWNELNNAARLLYSKVPYIQPLIESQTGIIIANSNVV